MHQFQKLDSSQRTVIILVIAVRTSNLARINPSAQSFKFRCRVSPAVIFTDRHLNFGWELIYSSLFLNYMRYKHETFTNMILKDGSIILFYNTSALYLSNGSKWFRSWGVYDTPWRMLVNTTLPQCWVSFLWPFLCTTHIFPRGGNMLQEIYFRESFRRCLNCNKFDLYVIRTRDWFYAFHILFWLQLHLRCRPWRDI
jgi:hypothetical protein